MNINYNKYNDDYTKNDEDDNSESNETISKSHNHIYFHADINTKNIFTLCELIRKCEIENITTAISMNINTIPIFLHIHSSGGYVYDALHAVDIIQSCKVPIHTIVEGYVASAGTIISVVGVKRYIRPNAQMLIHQHSSGGWGKMEELADQYKNNVQIMNIIMNIYLQYAKIPKTKLKEILKHDLWWNADICIKYGLVDEIWKG